MTRTNLYYLLSLVMTLRVSHAESFDDALASLRGSGKLPIFVPAAGSELAGGSFLQTGDSHKPLSVAEFTEWLHNLYYTEQQKRESAIKTLLDTDPLA